MLYFAYGSRMDFNEMRKASPSARFVAVAKLADHRLDFTAYSQSHDCGVADAVAAHGESIWGVVYDVPELEFGRLDQGEGYQPGRPAHENDCVRGQRHVYRDGNPHEPLLVWLYLASRKPHSPVPKSPYKGLMVGGARFWHLPADYVAQLERIDAV
jgi:gamma-glutamylcyclotransferase